MRRICSLGVVLIALAAAMSHTSAAPDTSGTQMMALSIEVYEQASPDAKRKMLAEPTIAVVPGREFRFLSGGITKTNGLEFGIRMNGKFDRDGDAACQLALNIAVGEKVVSNEDADVELVRSDSFDLRMVLQPGKTRRLHCAGSRWCEVRIDPLR